MSKKSNDGFELFGMITLLILAILAKGFVFEYLWNDFLIKWAGINLPVIGFWHAWLISVMIRFVVNGSSSSKSDK